MKSNLFTTVAIAGKEYEVLTDCKDAVRYFDFSKVASEKASYVLDLIQQHTSVVDFVLQLKKEDFPLFLETYMKDKVPTSILKKIELANQRQHFLHYSKKCNMKIEYFVNWMESYANFEFVETSKILMKEFKGSWWKVNYFHQVMDAESIEELKSAYQRTKNMDKTIDYIVY